MAGAEKGGNGDEGDLIFGRKRCGENTRGSHCKLGPNKYGFSVWNKQLETLANYNHWVGVSHIITNIYNNKGNDDGWHGTVHGVG